jgi:hypothetical protein
MNKPPMSSISRRNFLRGFGGVTLGLPFLETLAPRLARAQAAPVTTRFGVFFACNGVDVDRWFPNGGFGALTEQSLAGTANEVLAPLRSKLLIPRGVHMAPRGFGRDPGGGDDHGKGMAAKLTAQPADNQNWLAQGPSVDHVIAAQINPGTAGSRTPPLNLMVGRPGATRASTSSHTRAAAAPFRRSTTRGMPTRRSSTSTTPPGTRPPPAIASCAAGRVCSTWCASSSTT